MEDPRDTILRSIDLDGSYVLTPISHLFLCGGPSTQDCDHSPSFRAALLSDLKNSPPKIERFPQITLAEDIVDWFEDGVYKDLITFEDDLAAIANLIVLIVESPGSIAELGAFSQRREIRAKMLVVVDQEKSAGKSFIARGLIKYLKENYPKTIFVYPNVLFKTNHPSREIVEEVRNDVISRISNQPRKIQFHREDNGHVIFLIHDLVDYFFCLKLHEIQEFLSDLGIPLSIERVKQYLFLMVKVNLVERYEYGDDVYYFSLYDTAIIRFRHKTKHLDRTEFKFQHLRPFYQRADIRRLRAITRRTERLE